MTAPVAKSITTNPWPALWAMLAGFFMILVDSTIVAVANPSIMEKLGTDYDTVLWVTSAYLLAYAVPLLVAGRLGDQYGFKNLYLIGLFVFTAASLWCGLAGSIETLVAARVVQGVGAALLTPQTLSMITRIFPPDRRGVAMSLWGATAGVATLVGPLVGGVLVDHLGWQWIFFVNVPIGVIGLVLAAWLVPALPTNRHRFDVLGVILSGAAMFLVVFGLQEGEDYGWSVWIWVMIAAGVVLMGAFVYWQAVNKGEPLIPLRIFRDRNYGLSNIGVAVIGFAVTAMIVPAMFYAQLVCGLTPTRSALLTAPMAIATGALAPLVGRIVDRAHPTPVIGFGFSVLAIALTWLSVEMTPTTPIWRLLLPFTAMGLAMAFIWSPLAATATRNLAADLAGAGSGAYNATRQVGSVLGGAGIAAFMTSRISSEMPPGPTQPQSQGAVTQLPEFLREPFSAALSQSMLLPAFVALFGVVAAMFLTSGLRSGGAGPAAVRLADGREDNTDVFPVVRDDTALDSPYRRESAAGLDLFWRDRRDDDYSQYSEESTGFTDDAYDDDDDYVEFMITREPEPQPYFADEPEYEVDYAEDADDVAPDDSRTEPIATRVEHPRAAPAEVWHCTPVEAWRSLLADATPSEPIGFAHNGFHVEDEKFQPIPAAAPAPASYDSYADGFARLAENIDALSERFADLFEEQRPSRHGQPDSRFEGAENDFVPPDGHVGRRPRHYRDDPDDSPSHGRHSLPHWE